MTSTYQNIPEVGHSGENDNETSNLIEGVPEKKAAIDEWMRETSTAPPPEVITTEKWVMGIGYMAAMGVCGLVLVALGSTLSDLADNVGLSPTNLGSVFIARGFGAVLGAISSAKLYVWFAGLATAITDTGCQIMTRKLHGKAAGPWLGANTVAFGITGAIVPVIEIFTTSLVFQYDVMAAIVLAVSSLIAFGPNPESKGRLQGPPKKDAPKVQHFNVEMVISAMVFCFIGGKVTSTAYISTYVDQTGVMSEDNESKLVLVLWIAITIGGFLSMLLILWFPQNKDALWIGVAFYGLFNGPCVGYCYDWNNRITFPTEASMSVVMFGLNFGASLVPYITTLVWDHGGGPRTLIVCVFLSMFIPLPLLHTTKYLSYDPTVNPWLKNAYNSIPQDDKEDNLAKL
eukprot:gene18367-24064_t